MNPEPCLVIFQHAVTDKEKMKFITSKENKHTKVKGLTLHFSPKKYYCCSLNCSRHLLTVIRSALSKWWVVPSVT